jgi:hypothetical protein
LVDLLHFLRPEKNFLGFFGQKPTRINAKKFLEKKKAETRVVNTDLVRYSSSGIWNEKARAADFALFDGFCLQL